MKLPSFQFYPGDWLKDPNLSRSSLQAKGALIEIMCLAFECENRGVLKTGSHAWTIEEIARAMRGNTEENKNAIGELLELKVLKKNRKCAIFSQRMCKDEKFRQKRIKGGKLGGIHGVKGKEFGILGGRPKNKPGIKPPSEPPPSSSSSTSVIQKKEKERKINNPFFEMFRRVSGKHLTDEILETEIAKFQNKYPNIHPNQAGSLINTWVANIGKIKSIPTNGRADTSRPAAEIIRERENYKR